MDEAMDEAIGPDDQLPEFGLPDLGNHSADFRELDQSLGCADQALDDPMGVVLPNREQRTHGSPQDPLRIGATSEVASRAEAPLYVLV
jgi:hypothetical protein